MATAYSYLASLEVMKTEPDWDQLLGYYSEALVRQPGLTTVLNYRGVAYLRRDFPGDIQRAEAGPAGSNLPGPFLLPPAPFNLALALLREQTDETEEALGLLGMAEFRS